VAQWPSNSDLLPKPQGFTHASIADPGKLVHFADQITQALANMTIYIVGWNSDAAPTDPDHIDWRPIAFSRRSSGRNRSHRSRPRVTTPPSAVEFGFN